MIPQNIKNLVIKLTEKTNSKQASWEKTSRPDEFKLIFGKGAITTGLWQVSYVEMLDVAIYNVNGDKIESFVVSPDSDVEYKIIKELHDAAKREFYKVEETVDSLIDEILSNVSVGRKEVSEKDDLPF